MLYGILHLRVPPAALVMAVVAAWALGACSASPNPGLNGQFSLNTGRVALAGGSPEVALSICGGLLDKHAADVDLLVCKADALAALGRTAEAVDVYQAAIQRDPKSADAAIGLGRARLATDPAGAEALFLEALSHHPRDPAALNDLGIARDLQGRHADAQSAYGEAIAAAPGVRAPQVNLALSLAMAGRSGEAVRILRPIAERPDATVRERHDLAAALAMNGKPEEARRLLSPELDGKQSDLAVDRFGVLPAR